MRSQRLRRGGRRGCLGCPPRGAPSRTRRRKWRARRGLDPAGRAFVALLSCACEKLSAKRFDEYLSLGEVPALSQSRASSIDRRGAPVAVPDDEVYANATSVDDARPDDEQTDAAPMDSDDDAIVGGALRAPWKW